MLLTALLIVANPLPVETATVNSEQLCRVIEDHSFKSRRVNACGTKEEWAQYRRMIQKKQRQAVILSSSNGGLLSRF
jgi:hypothetical protein